MLPLSQLYLIMRGDVPMALYANIKQANTYIERVWGKPIRWEGNSGQKMVYYFSDNSEVTIHCMELN